MQKRMLVWCAAVLLSAAGGCVDKVQESVLTFNERVAVPIAQKAITETVANSYQFNVGAQAIEPGYKVKFRGALVQAFEGEVEIRLIGVSANATLGTQGAAAAPERRSDGATEGGAATAATTQPAGPPLDPPR